MEGLLPWVSAIAAFISTIVVWGFASGRWVQRREADAEQLDKVTKSIRDEDLAHRVFVDRVTTDMGRLESRILFNDEKELLRFQRVDEHMTALEQRCDRLEDRANDLHRQVHELQRQLDQGRRPQ